MSADFSTVNTNQQYSFLQSFGEYYRGKNKGSIDVLNNIFDQAEQKIHTVKTPSAEIQESMEAFEKSNGFSFVKKASATSKKVIRKSVKPQNINIIKQAIKLGKRGGGIALAIGATVGLCLIFKNYFDKSIIHFLL